jgi:hypothetical protein
MGPTEAVSSDDGHTHERNCLNCGCALIGAYCHCCGQHAHVHRTMTAFWHDLAHGVLHFEGKVWRTLPLLAWRPGELTRRYIDGQRASFVSPIALFLFVVFLMFAVVGLSGTLVDASGRQSIAESTAKAEQRIKSLEVDRARRSAAGTSTSTMDEDLASARGELAALNGLKGSKVEFGRDVQFSAGAPDWIRAPVEKAGQNPALLFYKLKTNAYKFSWALIPLSVPLVWLLFPFAARFRLYDHVVFVTYSLSFMTLLVVAAIALSAITSENAAAVLLLVPPVHMYRQLKGTYQLSRFGAAWRTFALTAFAFVAILLFVALLVGLGLFD